jgi:RNA polymerase sigma factor (TIGR02999 family)
MADTDATTLLFDWRRGNRAALDELFPLVYEELHRRAHAYLKGEREGHTLSTTALVHETYLKLLDVERVRWTDRCHFLALASTAMRRVLVDSARRHRAAKRGGGAPGSPRAADELSADPGWPDSAERAARMVALDRALDELATRSERLARTVELRYFGGMSIEEVAEVTGVAPSTVKLDWSKAKAFLYRELAAP